ncbi:hypothetical protein CPB86DRAFT_113105 [Serendipita vermifera]|nr:hypothetical protein CPB86DRAFT_113105 [Serendipita vermifera]
MNKPPSGYYPGQPPVGPVQGPPGPTASGQPYDGYTAWSAAAAAAAHQQYYQATAAAAAVNPPAPAINPYANYGYGPAVNWSAHPHHRPPPPPGAGPQIAQVATYPPYQPQAQPQPQPVPYHPQPQPQIQPQPQPQGPPVYPGRLPQSQGSQSSSAGPRQFQPPMKRQRIQSLPSNSQGRYTPASSQPPRSSSDVPSSLPNPPPTPVSFNRGPRSSTGSSGGLSRGRGHHMRTMRGGRGGSIGGRPQGNSSRPGSHAIPRGPRRGGFISSNSARTSRGGQFEAPQSHNGWGNGPVGAPSTMTTAAALDKEGKRTLTDFRILGFGFVSDHTVWSWGLTRPVSGKTIFAPTTSHEEVPPNQSVEDAPPVKQDDANDSSEVSGQAKEKGKRSGKETARIRIYFHPTSPTTVRGAPTVGSNMPPPNSVPSRTSNKRKKADSEEDDSDRANVKRHHADHTDDPRPASTDKPLAVTNGSSELATKVDDLAVDATPVSPPVLGDADQVSEFSNEAEWIRNSLNQDEEEEEGETDSGVLNVEEHDDVDDHSDFPDEVDEDEEGTSLFGSGVQPSSPVAEGVTRDLVVEPANGSSEISASQLNSTLDSHDMSISRNDASTSGVKEHPETNGKKASAPEAPFAGQGSGIGVPEGARNSISISFSSSLKRLLIDAEVIKYLKVFRAEGRIEFTASLQLVPPPIPDGDKSKPVIKGVCLAVRSDTGQQFNSIPIPSADNIEESLSSPVDASIPPLYGAMTVTFHVFLDTENPLSMPRWIKTGDVDDWLQSIFGIANHTSREDMKRDEESGLRGWEDKITVVDPDPAPTLRNILEHWATNSMVSQQKDREQFLKSYMFTSDAAGDEGYNLDNVLEIMLRLIRGDRPLIGSSSEGHHHHHHHHHHNSSNNIVHPILQAAVKSDYSLIANQTHTSLAVIAMFRVLQETATKYGGEDAKKEAENRIKDIIKALPQHMINKSLDATFQKWTNAPSSSSKNAGSSNTNAKGHR